MYGIKVDRESCDVRDVIYHKLALSIQFAIPIGKVALCQIVGS